MGGGKSERQVHTDYPWRAENVHRINEFWGEVKTSPEDLIKKAESMNLGYGSSSESKIRVHARFGG